MVVATLIFTLITTSAIVLVMLILLALIVVLLIAIRLLQRSTPHSATSAAACRAVWPAGRLVVVGVLLLHERHPLSVEGV